MQGMVARYGKPAGVLFLATFVVFQISLTLRNTHCWPFCSYTLFEFLPPPVIAAPTVRLFEADGSHQDVHDQAVLPVEGFIGAQYLQRILGTPGLGEPQKRIFAQRLLQRINTAPWGGFDEVHRSPRPRQGSHFVGLEYRVETYAFDLPYPGGETSPRVSTVLFSYREGP